MAAERSAPRSPGATCEPCGPGVVQNSGGETGLGIVECGQTARPLPRDRYTTARDRTGRFGDVAGRWVFWDFDGTLAARDRTWSGTLLDALAAVDPDHGLTVETLRPHWRQAPLARRGYTAHAPERSR